VTRRLFTTLCGLVFLVNFGRVAFAPLVPEFQQSLGLSAAAVGSVTTLVWLGTALPRIPVGYLLTRVRRERVVLATGVSLTIAAAFTATAESLLALRLGSLAVGLSTGGYFVAAIPLIGGLYPDETGRMVGVHGVASQIAPVVAPAVVVYTVAQYGEWRLVFWALATLALLTTGLLLFVLRDRDSPASAAPERDFRTALGHWRVVLAGIGFVVALGFVWQGTFNFYVSYLLDKGLSERTANGLLTLTFASGIPAFWLGGRLADRLPNVPYLIGINVAFVVGLLALTVAESILAIALVSVFLGLAAHSTFPATDTYMLSTLPPAGRASAYALFSGTALLLEAGGSGVVGALRDSGIPFDTVYQVLALAVGVVTLVVGLLHVVGRVPTPGSQHDTSETTESV
jgi:predicted MFS family arabinose efflux permease